MVGFGEVCLWRGCCQVFSDRNDLNLLYELILHGVGVGEGSKVEGEGGTVGGREGRG